MEQLSTSAYPAAYKLYLGETAFFPLIGSVLLGEQDGSVYADRPNDPQQVYVEHRFGFAQAFGAPTPNMEKWLHQYLLIEKAFPVAKVRLYTPIVPAFLNASDCVSLRSYRQRFRLAETGAGVAIESTTGVDSIVKAEEVDWRNVDDVDRLFGVITRFWPSPEDFIKKAGAVLARVQDEPAAICYAAAVADNCAEIDVLTRPEFRRMGVGRFAVLEFIRQCLAGGRRPLWDCFSNNAGSMALCRACGFVPVANPYPFFTINKQCSVVRNSSLRYEGR